LNLIESIGPLDNEIVQYHFNLTYTSIPY
jgi:hypothetical protein